MKVKEVIDYIEQGYEVKWDVETSFGKINKLVIEPTTALKALRNLTSDTELLAVVEPSEKSIYLEY